MSYLNLSPVPTAPLMVVTNPDTLRQGDVIINTVSVIVLTGNRNPSGSLLEAEVYGRKDGAFKGFRSYSTDTLFGKVDAGWTLYRAEDEPRRIGDVDDDPDNDDWGDDDPPPAAPTTALVCELCEEPADTLNAAAICDPCHEAGVMQLELERQRYATPEAEELAWAVAVLWLTPEEAGL